MRTIFRLYTADEAQAILAKAALKELKIPLAMLRSVQSIGIVANGTYQVRVDCEVIGGKQRRRTKK